VKSKNIIIAAIVVVIVAAAFVVTKAWRWRPVSLKVQFPKVEISVAAPVATDRSSVWETTHLRLSEMTTAAIKLLILQVRQRSKLQPALHLYPI
jgi:hypothetical protein